MAETTNIEWADRTWSPWIGCTKVSRACDGCYAEHLMDTRMGRVEWGPHGERSRTSADYWRKPLAWDREARAAGRTISVFPSLCDPFDNRADPAVRRAWFDLIRVTPHLTWLLLTKRPQNAVEMSGAAGGLPGNVALGATCEDQKRVDLNVPALLRAKEDTGAQIAFLSCEPLLGPIQIFEYLPNPLWNDIPSWKSPELDWIITGGETDQGQHKARPTNPEWFRSLRDQCAAAGVPYLHKQNGEWADASTARIAQHGPVTSRSGDVSDWMDRSVTFEDGSSARLRAHSFTAHATDLVFRVGKKVAGRTIDGVTHDGFPTPTAEGERA